MWNCSERQWSLVDRAPMLENNYLSISVPLQMQIVFMGISREYSARHSVVTSMQRSKLIVYFASAFSFRSVQRELKLT